MWAIKTEELAVLSSFLCVLRFAAAAAQDNPGVIIRLSQPCMEQAARRYSNAIEARIDSVPYEVKTGASSNTYSLTNFEIVKLNIPNTQVRLTSGKSVTLILESVVVGCKFNWRYSKKILFFTVSDKGSADVRVKMTLEVAVAVGANADGKPTVGLVSSSSSVDDLAIKIYGGAWTWLYQVMSSLFKGKIKGMIGNEIKKAVGEGVRKMAETIAKFETKRPFGKQFVFDIGLFGNPGITADYIEIPMKAKFELVEGDATEPPIKAPDMVLPHGIAGRMVKVAASSFPFDTLGYAISKSSYATINITKSSLDPQYAQLLNTNCSRGEDCIGAVSDVFANEQPNVDTKVVIRLVDFPRMSINSDDTVSGTLAVRVLLVSVRPGGSEASMLTLDLSVLGVGKIGISGNRLLGRMVSLKLKVNSLSSPVLSSQPPKEDVLTAMAQKFVDGVILQYMNVLGDKGFDIPTLDGARLVDPKVTCIQNAMTLDMDVDLENWIVPQAALGF